MNDLDRTRRRKKAWQRFLEAERRALEYRRDGQLSRSFAGISPTSESAQWELMWLDQEDRETAKIGLVELRSPAGEIEYKHIDELTHKDCAARVEAQRVRLQWIQNTQRTRIFSGDGHREEIEETGGRAQDRKSRSAQLPSQKLAGGGTVADAPGGTVLRLRDVGADGQGLRAGNRERRDGISHATADGEGGIGKVLVGNFEKRTGAQGVHRH